MMEESEIKLVNTIANDDNKFIKYIKEILMKEFLINNLLSLISN
jgi:hypothetical protein